MTLHRILCIDDDPDVRTLLEIALATVAKFEVAICRSAREACSVIADFAPDLLVLDDRMPETDGASTMRLLFDHAGARNCPTVFLTALANPEDVDRLLSLGAIAVISKPFDPMALGDELRRLFEQTGTGSASASPRFRLA